MNIEASQTIVTITQARRLWCSLPKWMRDLGYFAAAVHPNRETGDEINREREKK